MKYFSFFILISTITICQAQIVNIPDSNFKNVLLSSNLTNQIARDVNYDWMIIDINNDGEIQESEAQNVAYLHLEARSISSLDGIDKFINLLYLDCNNNNLTAVSFNSTYFRRNSDNVFAER